jgi:glutamate-ammonia-ligase adenylyltransferase
MDDPEQALSHLRALRDGRACRVASATARQRLTALLPGLLRAAATTERPTLTLGRLCTLLDAVATRSVYLAMLLEHPPAQDHLARLMAASCWMRARCTGLWTRRRSSANSTARWRAWAPMTSKPP